MDGVIKIYNFHDTRLHLVFESENVRLESGEAVTWRRILSLATVNERVYYGDDGMNIKVLQWKRGRSINTKPLPRFEL